MLIDSDGFFILVSFLFGDHEYVCKLYSAYQQSISMR
jgi:hypothetical protein